MKEQGETHKIRAFEHNFQKTSSFGCKNGGKRRAVYVYLYIDSWSPSHGRGHRFESRTAHHLSLSFFCQR